MPSLKKLGLPLNKEDPTNTASGIPYSQQHYYKESFARQLERSCLTFIANGRAGISWNYVKLNETEKRLRLRINCARSYIIHNPDDFDAEVVTLLNAYIVAKRGTSLTLLPRAESTHHQHTGAGAGIQAVPLDVGYDLGDEYIPTTHAAAYVPSVIGDGVDIAPPITQPAPQLPNNKPFTLAEPILRDLDELIKVKPVSTMYERADVNLSDETIAVLKALLKDSPTVIGRVNRTIIKILKTTDYIP